MSEEEAKPEESEEPVEENDPPEVEEVEEEEKVEEEPQPAEEEESGIHVEKLPDIQEEMIDIEDDLPPDILPEGPNESDSEEVEDEPKKTTRGPYEDITDTWINTGPTEKEKKETKAAGQKNMGLLNAFRDKAEEDKEDLGDIKNELSQSQKTKEREIMQDEAPDKSLRKRKEKDARLFDRYSIFPTKKWRGGTKNEYILRYRNSKCYPQDSFLTPHYGLIEERLAKGHIKHVIYVPPKKQDSLNVEWNNCLLIQFSDDSIYYKNAFHHELTFKKHGIPGRWNIFLERKRGDHLIASQKGRIKYINYRNEKKVFMSTLKIRSEVKKKKKTAVGMKGKRRPKNVFKDAVTAVGFNRHKLGSKTVDYVILGTSGLQLYYVEIKLNKKGEGCKSSFDCSKLRTLRKDPSAPRSNSVTSIVIEEEAYKDYIFVMVSTHFELYMFRGKRISETEPFRFISFSSLMPVEHKYKGYNASPLRVYYRHDMVKDEAATSGLDKLKKKGGAEKKKKKPYMSKKQKIIRKKEEEEALDVIKETFYVPHSFVQMTTQGLLHGKFNFSKVDEDETAEMKKRAQLFSTPSRKKVSDDDDPIQQQQGGDGGDDDDEEEEQTFIGSSEDPIPHLHKGNLFIRDFEHLVFSDDRDVDWLKSSESKPIDVACSKYHILFFRKDSGGRTDLTILHYPPDLCQSLYGTKVIQNDMITFKRTFNEPHDYDYTGFSTSPYDESNVVMYGKDAIKTLCPFQELRHMYPVYFKRARLWKEIKKLYEERKISYEEAQIQYELCRKYFLQLVVAIYSNQDKREELVILELAHFCMSCGWLDDAAIYFALTKISVEEVMELFLEIDHPQHLRTYLMYKYKYKALRMDHPISRKFSAVGYHQFKIQCQEEPDCRTKSLSIIQVHTVIVELYLQELNALIRKLEVSVKTESIQKKITNLKMELLLWLTKNLKVKNNCNVNLIYQLMTSYGHFDIAFQFVLKQRTFEEVLTLWLEGKRGTNPNFDIFKHVVDRMDGDEKNLKILLKFARHLFTKAPTRTSESLGMKPKLGPALVNFLPSLTNYGDFISNEFDLSNPKYLCDRAQQRLLDLNSDGLCQEEIESYSERIRLFSLRDSDVDRILNYYHSFDREQMKFLRSERKRLMVRLVSTIQLYERGQEHAKGMRREMEVLNNQILFLLYQKLGNPTQILKLNEEIKTSEHCLEFNVRNITRNKLVTPFSNLAPHQHLELGLHQFHSGDFMNVTRKIRAYEIMGDCCHALGLNMMGIRHMIYAAFLTRRLHVAIEEKERREREAVKGGGGAHAARKKPGFNLEIRKGFRFLQKASQFANNPVVISKEGERMESNTDNDSGEGDSDELKSMKRFLWGFLLRTVMSYEEEVEPLIQEDKNDWKRYQTRQLKTRFSNFYHKASKDENFENERNRYYQNVRRSESSSDDESEDEDDEEENYAEKKNLMNRYLKSKGLESGDIDDFGKVDLPTTPNNNNIQQRRIIRRRGGRRGRKPLRGIYARHEGAQRDFQHLTQIMKETSRKSGSGVEEHKDFFFDVKELQDSNLDRLIKKKGKKDESERKKKKKKRGIGGIEGQEDDEGKNKEDSDDDSDDSSKIGSSGESSEEMEGEGEDEQIISSSSADVSHLLDGSGSVVSGGGDVVGGQGQGQKKGSKKKDEKKKKKKKGDESEDVGGQGQGQGGGGFVRRKYEENIRIRTIRNTHEVRVEFIANLMIIQKGHYVSLYDFLSVLPEDTTIGKFYRELAVALDREHDESEEKWKEIKQYTRREDDFAKPNEFLLFKGNQKCDCPDCELEYILKGKDELFSFNCGHVFHGECLEKKLVGARDLVNIAFYMQAADVCVDEEKIPREYYKNPLMTEISLDSAPRFDEDSEEEEEDGMAVLEEADEGEDENNIVATPFRLSQLQLKQVIKRLKKLDEMKEREKGSYKSNDHKMNRVFKRILKRIELKSRKDNIMTSICPLCSTNQISDIHMQLFALDEMDEWRIPGIRPKPPPDDSSSDEGGRRKKKKKKQDDDEKEKEKEKEKVKEEKEKEEKVEEEEEEEEIKVEEEEEEEEEEDVIVEEEEEDEDEKSKGDGKKE